MKVDILGILKASKAAGWVVEPLALEILRSYGLPVVEAVWARTLEELLAGGARTGYPLAVKVVSPLIMHKSEAGGVAVGIEDETALKAVFLKMAKLPGFDGVVVEAMSKGVELIVGSKLDSQFGTVVMVGIGGTSVEVYKDVAIRLAPVTPKEAKNALASLKGSVFLNGFRGSPPVDKKALAEFLVTFSEIAHELTPHVESIDLNPVFCNEDGCVIADARMVLMPRTVQAAENGRHIKTKGLDEIA